MLRSPRPLEPVLATLALLAALTLPARAEPPRSRCERGGDWLAAPAGAEGGEWELGCAPPGRWTPRVGLADVPLVLGLGGWALGVHLAPAPTHGEAWAPSALDAPGLHPPETAAGWAALSDALLLGVPVLSVAPLDAGHGGGARTLGRGVIQAEAVALTWTTTELLKRAVARPRPWVGVRAEGPPSWFTGGPQAADEAYVGFPSGHTAAVAAAGFAWATERWLEDERLARPLPLLLLYGGAGALTALTGVARVQADAHHPGDVLAGALIGLGYGVGLPLLHALPAGGAGRPPAVTLQLTPAWVGASGRL